MREFRFLSLLLLVCGSLHLAGCLGGRTPDSHFYTLTPPETRTGQAASPSGRLLTVGPIDIPDYLNRRQIVTRTGLNELVVAEFDRWGGSLDSEITRSLVADLADRLAPRGITVLPWKSFPLMPAQVSYRVPVSIARFDGQLGESAVLSARWELYSTEGTKEAPPLVRAVTITEKAEGGGYQSQVAAMQRALGRLGAEMAESIAAVITP